MTHWLWQVRGRFISSHQTTHALKAVIQLKPQQGDVPSCAEVVEKEADREGWNAEQHKFRIFEPTCVSQSK